MYSHTKSWRVMHSNGHFPDITNMEYDNYVCMMRHYRTFVFFFHFIFCRNELLFNTDQSHYALWQKWQDKITESDNIEDILCVSPPGNWPNINNGDFRIIHSLAYNILFWWRLCNTIMTQGDQITILFSHTLGWGLKN